MSPSVHESVDSNEPDNSSEPRTSIIKAVTTPLSFLVLGFLIVDGTVASLAVGLPPYRTPLVSTVIAAIPFFIFVVIILAVWRPEALRGERPLQDIHASQFASDLFIAMDGALRNLEPSERTEAWSVIVEVITNDENANTAFSEFRRVVASKLSSLVNLNNRQREPRGPIKP